MMTSLSHFPVEGGNSAWFQQQLLESSPLGTLLLTPDPLMPVIVYVNAAFEDLTGYSRELVLGQPLSILRSFIEDQPSLTMLKNAFETQTACVTTFSQSRIDGSLFWAEVHLSPLRDQQSHLTHWLVGERDITQERAYLQQLEANQAQLTMQSMALEATANAIVMADLEFKITWCNAAFANLTGFSRDALYGHGVGHLIRSGLMDETFYHTLWDTILSGKIWQGRVINRRKDGTLYIVTQTITPVRDASGQIRRFIAIQEDITEQLQIEQALQESAVQYQSVIDSLSEGIILQSTDGTITACNAAVEHVLGLTPHQMMSHTSLDLGWQTIHEDGSLFPSETYPSMITLRTGQALSQVIMGVHKPDQSLVWVLINTQPIFKSGFERPTAVVMSLTDITAYKHAQAQIFEIALEKERIEMLSKFIQDAAHEFRTPLAIIGTSTYRLARSDEAQKRELLAQRIEDQVQRMAQLVSNLLTMVHLKSGILSPEASINPVRLVQLAHAEIRRSLSGLALTYDVEVVPPIWGHENELREAFKQLIENAMRYTSAEGHVTIRIIQENKSAVIEVIDTGKDIAPLNVPSIFDTFWRDDTAHSTPGFGLGLTIVKQTIEMHGGTIEVESIVGQGSTFRVRLPLADQH